MIRYEMLRGLAYRRIRHPDMHWYTKTIPATLTAIAVGIFFILPQTPKLLGSSGLLSSTLSVVSTLPGFYFAGLAAVATFAGPNMDRVMPSPPAKLGVIVSGGNYDLELSRRQFLSYLFAYLVLLSFVLCIFIIGTNGAELSISKWRSIAYSWNDWGHKIWTFGKFTFVILIMGITSSIVVTTLHGMFFLAERIHQP